MTLSNRQIWLAAMRFEEMGRVPDEEFGYWDETLMRWHNEGLPKHINTNEAADEFFGFAYKRWAPVNTLLCPAFEPQVLEETDDYQIVIDNEGTKSVIHKTGQASIPHYLKFPIETHEDWENFRVRLDASTPGRYPENWDELVRDYNSRDYVLAIHCGSLLGVIRNWMGFENFCYAVADDPAFVQEMINHLTDLSLSVIDRAIKDVQFDLAHFWEDVAYNGGSMVSPSFFERVVCPCYARITQRLKEHGVDFVSVDCDGTIDDLVPLWLDAGVNTMFPLEQNGGADPSKFRKLYGRRVLLSGGVDKTKLAAGKSAIDAELRRLEPVIKDGGYIPHLDHRCPPDVSYDDYLYYLDAKRAICGS